MFGKQPHSPAADERANRKLQSLLAIVICWLLWSPLLLAQVSVSGWTPPAARKTESQAPPSIAEKATRGEAPLSRKYSHLKFETARVHRLSAPDPRELREKKRLKKVRVGIIRPFSQPLNALGNSTVYQVAEGRLYVFRTISEDAVQLRLRFGQMALPDGARLFVSSAKNPDEFYGPYQGRGPHGDGAFWTPPISGDEVIVEYLLPDAPTGLNQAASPFRITEVSHIFADPGTRTGRNRLASSGCNLDVPPEWSEAAKSVGLLQFTEEGGEYLCSGTLLNTTNNSGAPYVLTANHCIGDLGAARSLKVYWLYTAGTTPPSNTTNYGSTLLATAEANDFTLVRLNTSVPAGVRFSGWTTQMPAPSTPVTGIHHPRGDHQRIAFGQAVNETCPEEFLGELCDNFIKLRWSSGIVEPGSSGSGLWTGPASDPKLVGTLTGGASSCEHPTAVDYYGRFDLAFEAISYYLTGEGCAYSISRRRQAVSAAGGSGQVDVISMEGDGCAWTARSNVPWITITSNSSGSGDGVVSYSIAPNPAAKRRVGILSMSGQTLIVVQAGTDGNCTATEIALGQTVSGNLGANSCQSAFNFGFRADRYTFTATAGQAIAISLDSSVFDTDLTLRGPNGELIAENDDNVDGTNARIPFGRSVYFQFITLPVSGTYTIEASSYDPDEGGSYTLNLEKSCVYTVTPTKQQKSAGGRDLSNPDLTNQVEVEISGASTCTFLISSDVSWIHPGFQSTITGSKGKVLYSVDTNQGLHSRTGIIHVAGIPVIIKEAASCNDSNRPTISPPSRSFNGDGGIGTVQVTMAPGAICSWGIDYNQPIWLSSQTEGGTGDGVVRYGVMRYTGVRTRTGVLMIAGQPHTVTQEPYNSDCGATPLTFGQTINESHIAGDCIWLPDPTVYADKYSFTGLARQQVAFTVSSPDSMVYFALYNQAGAMLWDTSYLYNQKEIRHPTTGYFDLPENGEYTLVITGKSGQYTLKPESFGGPGCAYLISAAGEQSVSPSGGSGMVSLTATGSCTWAATSNAGWVTFPEGASGQGSKDIIYVVAPNTGAARRAMVTIGNRAFNIFQDAPCSYVKVDPKISLRYNDDSFFVRVETGAGCQLNSTSLTDWITFDRIGFNGIYFKVSRNPGNYRRGTIDISGRMVEVAQGSSILEMVSAADYRPGVAPGSLVSIFGENLASATEAAASVPLPTGLAATFVVVYDANGATFAQLLYVSPTQINFLMPDRIQPGTVRFEVRSNDGGPWSAGAIKVESTAPSLFSATATGQGLAAAVAVRVKADNTQVYETVGQFDAAQNRFIASPIDLSDPSEQVFLLLFGTGIRYRSAPSAVTAKIGGEAAEVWYAGAQGSFAGLDQVNLRLPRSLARRGEVDIVLTVDGKAANTVRIHLR